MINRRVFFIMAPIALMVANLSFAKEQAVEHYVDKNQGIVSFDVSMPVDATGYTLQGKNLKGGAIQFVDNGTIISPSLAHETGFFHLPVVTSIKNKPLIDTTIHFNVIKFINPVGIGNLFIKVGTASRHEKVSGVDQFALKDGSYTWEVPVFSAGKEKDNFPAGLGENMQMMQVGSTGGPSTQNSIYTRDFYLYTQAESDAPIVGHPIKLARSNEILQQSYKSSYMCYAHGVWGSRADPYRAIKGQCHGSSMTFPAGPNLDYEYGTFTFPTVYSPWDGSKQDHCIIDGKRHEGCTEVSVASEMHYMTQKIRVPINKNISIYAESGTLYRRMQPDNLRYECKVNVYLKNILPSEDCLTKSYLHGGWSAPYFAVGYIYKDAAGKSYDARYIYIPEKENSDRLAWRDASDTEIYAVSAGQEMPSKSVRENMRKYLNETLKVLSRHPVLYQVLGKRFFIATLKKNHLYEETGE